MTHLSKPIDYTTPRVNHNVNYRFWGIVCQRRFNFKKWTTRVGHVDDGGGGQGDTGNLFLPLDSYVSLKLLLKN